MTKAMTLKSTTAMAATLGLVALAASPAAAGGEDSTSDVGKLEKGDIPYRAGFAKRTSQADRAFAVCDDDPTNDDSWLNDQGAKDLSEVCDGKIGYGADNATYADQVDNADRAGSTPDVNFAGTAGGCDDCGRRHITRPTCPPGAGAYCSEPPPPPASDPGGGSDPGAGGGSGGSGGDSCSGWGTGDDCYAW